ncbi:hypothetical protein [Roseomonas sp. CECT 9278]|uniref:hypothetical protein n=1 Tax=Roseomonas sp. CECT 9278 TaxID=2845823 RepID=UPI001E437351|nr:hypothetical protein [Roseomonas sp. CECT 9278]CAH0259023.1 hypothetical protein ROS9278_03346 [Roseomonas sp. CECT 9278]
MIDRRSTLRSFAPVLIALGAGIGLGACRAQPIYESANGQFQGRGSLAEREALIRRAAASQGGWSVQSMRPGLLRATNTWRSHQMTVDISFDIRTFTIRYVNSVNLDYNGAQIHSAYNDRVQALERAILQGSGAGLPVSGGGRGGSDAVPASGPVVSYE